MSFLQKAISFTENTEGLNGLAQGLKKLADAQNATETAAASAQILAELAVAGAVTATIRTAMSATRLGLAVSGQIGKWEALSKLSGISAGLTAGAIIDWVEPNR